MSYELVISAQRDPRVTKHLDGRDGFPCASHAELALNGSFDESAARAVLKSVSKISGEGTRSIVVDMQDVEVSDASCLHGFASEIMAQRSEGVHVQVAARHAELHARLAQLPDARDWLLVFAKTDVASARVAIHVDGVNSAD